MHVVVPTLASGDDGLPHTLEHLVFCGSHRHPHRGLLDTLATRALSPGTNAYTAEDHTAYSWSAAASDGLSSVAPVFLHHILSPTLRHHHFITEVFHHDHLARPQGVVYCEMAARELSEVDSLDRVVRKVLFGKEFRSTPMPSDVIDSFAHECGGLTPHIANLSIDMIRNYHARFYTPNNTTILIGGQCDIHTVLDALNAMDLFNTPPAQDSLPVLSPMQDSLRQVSSSTQDSLPQLSSSTQDSLPQLSSSTQDSSPTHISSPTHDSLPQFSSPTLHSMPIVTSPPPHQFIPFPSPDTSLCTTAFCFHGPTPFSNDLDLLALSILLKFLCEDGAGLLWLLFVEGKKYDGSNVRASKRAMSVDWEVKATLESGVVVYVTGCPYKDNDDDDDDKHGSNENEDGKYDLNEKIEKHDSNEKNDEKHDSNDKDEKHDSNEKSDDDSSDDDSESSDDDDDDKFDPQWYRQELDEALKYVASTLLHQPSAFRHLHTLMKRQRVKMVEHFEDDPLGYVTDSLLASILKYHHLDKKQSPSAPMHFKTDTLDLLDALRLKPPSFWSDLVTKYLITPSSWQVTSVPDPEFAKRHESEELSCIESRKKELGKEGLARLKDQVEEAKKLNAINIPHDILASLPPVPDPLPPLPSRSRFIPIKQFEHGTGFSHVHVSNVPTNFINISLSLPLDAIDPTLIPLLVVFQELIFQSSLLVPSSFPYLPTCTVSNHQQRTNGNSGENVYVAYDDASRMYTRELVDYEAGVGMGNALFSTSYMATHFVVGVTVECPDLISNGSHQDKEERDGRGTEREDWKRSVESAVRKATMFAMGGVVWMKPEKERVKKVVESVLSDVTEMKRDGGQMVDAVLARICDVGLQKSVTNRAENIKALISVFCQEKVQKRVKERMKSDPEGVMRDLERMKMELVQVIRDRAIKVDGFVHVAVPMHADADFVAETFIHEWKHQISILNHEADEVMSPKRSKLDSPRPAFPFPRNTFQYPSLPHVDPKIVYPITGITASYILQLVPVAIPTPQHPDYAPTVFLCSLLSRSEGPLYTALRGSGISYDVSVSMSLWHGYLVWEVSECSDVTQAFQCWRTVLESWRDGGWQVGDPPCLFRQVEWDAALAGVIYREVSGMSAPMGVAAERLRAALLGFESLEEYQALESFKRVSASDLKRVFFKYMLPFLDETKTITAVVTPPNPSLEGFTVTSWDDLAIELC